MGLSDRIRNFIWAHLDIGKYTEYLANSDIIAIVSDPAQKHVHALSGLSLIMDKARAAVSPIKKAMPFVFSVSFLIVASACSVLIIIGAGMFFPETGTLTAFFFSLLPAILFGLGAGHIFGNYFIYAMAGLNDQERRSLALHLPWNKNPKNWPKYFRRWLYCGDWLVDNFSGDFLPYVRAFVTGDAPQTIEEELELWSEFLQNSRHNFKIEVGHSIRELACVDSLPVWTKDITPGMDLPALEKALGTAGHKWAVNLLKRAASRKRIFCNVNFSGDLSEIKFEFHYCLFESGREGIMVIIRPSVHSAGSMEETFSDALSNAS